MTSSPETVAPFGPAVPARLTPTSPTGRARALDDESKRTIAALVAQGYSLSAAAAHVACDRKTVFNERRRDEHFDFNIKRAFAMRTLDPLNVVRQAAKSHWRAAAWLLDREEKRLKGLKADRRQRATPEQPASAAPAAAIDDPPSALVSGESGATPTGKNIGKSAAQNSKSARRSSRPRRRRAKRRMAAAPAAAHAAAHIAAQASPVEVETRFDALAARLEAMIEAASPQALAPPGEDCFATNEFPHVGKNAAQFALT